MSAEKTYSIGDLARLAGVTPRTIRYYTAEGLLPPPEARGKYACYGEAHLGRLQAIARLKADYLPLSVIRERLAQGEAGSTDLAQGEDVGAYVRQGGAGASHLPPRVIHERLAQGEGAGASMPPGASGARPLPPGVAAPAAGAAHMRAEDGPALAAGAAEPFRLTPASVQAGRVEFFPSEPELLGAEGEQAAGASGRWQRIALAPGVELHVREPLSERRRRQLEELVAGLRDRLRQLEED